MTCNSPPALTDSQLQAHLDGEADASIAGHLARCEDCRRLADQLARAQSRISAHLYRFDCPSTLDLGEYADESLPAAQMKAIDLHVAECPHCAAELKHFQTAPPELAPATTPPFLERLKVLLAQLVEGESGGLTPAFAGLRGQENGPTLYQAGDIQIAIEFQPVAGRPGWKTLLGLVTDTDLEGLEAHLSQAEQVMATALIEAHGAFVLPDLAPGTYQLMLRGPEVEIHIQDLVV